MPSADEQDNVRVQEDGEQEQEIDSTEIGSTGIEEQMHRPPNPVIVFFFKAIKLLLLPFCKIFFAPTAQRTFVKTTVMALTVSYIVATSMIAYILFYNKYVPPITHVQPIWFHYTTTQGPQAIVNIATVNSVVSFYVNHQTAQLTFISLCDMIKFMMFQFS